VSADAAQCSTCEQFFAPDGFIWQGVLNCSVTAADSNPIQTAVAAAADTVYLLYPWLLRAGLGALRELVNAGLCFMWCCCRMCAKLSRWGLRLTPASALWRQM
jgi:hypothetical protein